MSEIPFPIEEATGSSSLTPQQQDRLDGLDWYIDTELPIVMKENKEYGILQAQWRHSDRLNKYLYEGIDKRSTKD